MARDTGLQLAEHPINSTQERLTHVMAVPITTGTAPGTRAPEPPASRHPRSPAAYRLTVPNDETAPRLLRDFLAAVLQLAAPERLVEDAKVCLSEIVSNTYRHTGAEPVRLYIVVRPGRVLVAVTDSAPAALPVRRDGRPYAEHGRGLTLVQALSDRFGCRVHTRDGRPYEKTVWFVLKGGGLGSAEAS